MITTSCLPRAGRSPTIGAGMARELDPQTQLRLKTTRESLHVDFDPVPESERIDAIFDDSIAQVRSDDGFDDYDSKPLAPEVLAAADVVVMMGRSTGVVEILEGTGHVDRRIGDPGGAPMDEVRRVAPTSLPRRARVGHAGGACGKSRLQVSR